MNQYSRYLLMIRPNRFAYNKQTALNNFYQKKEPDADETQIAKKAIEEFDVFVSVLKNNGVNVIVFEDNLTPHTPDSVFPNNWISFHCCGTVFLYPMFAQNRREERREDILKALQECFLFNVQDVVDFTENEKNNRFLEGTGSMVLDRENKICYAALSSRTDEDLVVQFCEKMSYEPCIFHAYQLVSQKKESIYHTNVMMCLADKYVVICLDCVYDEKEKEMLLSLFKKTNKEVIEITENQKRHFAGNMLQVQGNDVFLVMSSTAYKSLDKGQIDRIEKYNSIIHVPLNTIEENGGGSARCMIAEVFLQKNKS